MQIKQKRMKVVAVAAAAAEKIGIQHFALLYYPYECITVEDVLGY